MRLEGPSWTIGSSIVNEGIPIAGTENCHPQFQEIPRTANKYHTIEKSRGDEDRILPRLEGLWPWVILTQPSSPIGTGDHYISCVVIMFTLISNCKISIQKKNCRFASPMSIYNCNLLVLSTCKIWETHNLRESHYFCFLYLLLPILSLK